MLSVRATSGCASYLGILHIIYGEGGEELKDAGDGNSSIIEAPRVALPSLISFNRPFSVFLQFNDYYCVSYVFLAGRTQKSP